MAEMRRGSCQFAPRFIPMCTTARSGYSNLRFNVLSGSIQKENGYMKIAVSTPNAFYYSLQPIDPVGRPIGPRIVLNQPQTLSTKGYHLFNYVVDLSVEAQESPKTQLRHGLTGVPLERHPNRLLLCPFSLRPLSFDIFKGR